MIFGKPPDHLIKVATLIKDYWGLWVVGASETESDDSSSPFPRVSTAAGATDGCTDGALD